MLLSIPKIHANRTHTQKKKFTKNTSPFPHRRRADRLTVTYIVLIPLASQTVCCAQIYLSLGHKSHSSQIGSCVRMSMIAVSSVVIRRVNCSRRSVSGIPNIRAVCVCVCVWPQSIDDAVDTITFNSINLPSVNWKQSNKYPTLSPPPPTPSSSNFTTPYTDQCDRHKIKQ